MKVLMIFMSDENDARSPCCLYANPSNQKLRMPAYLHLQVFMVSLSRANQRDSARQPAPCVGPAAHRLGYFIDNVATSGHNTSHENRRCP
jgi:hypothetical protein